MVYNELNWETENFILKRFKLTIFKVIENQNFIEIPNKWQLLLSEGYNIIWNSLEYNKLIKENERAWVVTGWKKTIIHSNNQNPFNRNALENEKFEPRIFIDTNQDDNFKSSDTNYSDLEIFMEEMWKNYSKTKNIEYLAKASEMAPFFGQKEISLEIGKLLRNIKN